MYEDGTNVRIGTKFREFSSITSDWYRPAESTAPQFWWKNWTALRRRFEAIVDSCRPVECSFVQTRIPAYARDAVPSSQALQADGLFQIGGGLWREPAQLFGPDFEPLAGAFPIRDATGKPMSNSAGDAFAFQFGLFRQFSLYPGPNHADESRPVPHPRISELAREGAGLLYQLPAKIAASVWRNWLKGFDRRGNSSEYLWLDALFELSWHRKPGDALYSKRYAWFENVSVELIGDGLFPRLPDGLPTPGSIPEEGGYPMAHRAKLPDVARASIYAIDEILDRGRRPRRRPHPVPPPTVSIRTAKATILFFASNPDGVQELALDEEARAIRDKIRTSSYRSSLRLLTKRAVRPDDLLQYLNTYRPHIVHFSGHGSQTEELILHNKHNLPKPVGKAALRALFKALKDNIRLVVLNACYSRAQAEAIVEVIDCAVGMNRAIGDEAAIVFAASFYRALGFGRSVRDAFEQGCVALQLEGIPGENTPELLVKPGVDASQVFLAGPTLK